MAAAGAVTETLPTLTPFQTGAFDGATLATIQNTFHFDTNNFLIPEPGEESALDYAELFSILNDKNAQSSGGGPSVDSDEGGAPLRSAGPVQTGERPRKAQQFSVAHPRRSDAGKAARDVTSKRVRDSANTKNKQQQVKELEALAAQKCEEMERLTRENSALKFRKQLLEKVVRLRDHQLKVMRGGNEFVAQPWCDLVPGLPAASPTCSSSEGCGSGSNSAVACNPGGDCSTSGAGGGGGGNGECPALQAIRTRSCGCLLSSPGLELPPVDRERFRSMGKLQFMESWKLFLTEVSVPLLAVESDPRDEAAAQSILRLVRQATYLCKHTSLLAGDTVIVVSQTHLETEMLSPAEPSHWQNVIRTLELTAEQVSEVRAVFQLYSDIMRGVLAERRAINERLSSGLHGSMEELLAGMEKLTVSPECEVLQSLQRSMRREKSAHLLLRGFLFGQTFSALQFVKAAVYSYPWMPDATALTATIAEMADAPGGFP